MHDFFYQSTPPTEANMDNPVQTKCSTGRMRHHNTRTPYGVQPLVGLCDGRVHLPRATYLARGYLY
jgi:hypothetical protein